MTRPVVVVSSLHRFAPENLETSPLSMRIRETSAGQEGVGVYLSVVTFFLLILVRLPLHLAHLSFPIARTFFNCFLSRSFLPSTLQKKKSYVRAVVSTRDMHRTGHCVLEETETAGPFAGQSFISFSVFCWKEGKQPATSARRGNTFPGRMLVRAHTHTHTQIYTLYVGERIALPTLDPFY